MAVEYWMYHKERAPRGRLFTESDRTTPEAQAKLGWVDDPTKHGLNLWDQSPETNQMVDERRAAFDDGRLKALDGRGYMSDQDVDDLREAQYKIEQLEARLREQNTLAQDVRQDKEEMADTISDASARMSPERAKHYDYKKERKGEAVPIPDHVNGEITFESDPVEFLAGVIKSGVDNGRWSADKKPMPKDIEEILGGEREVGVKLRNQAWEVYLSGVPASTDV